MKPPGRACRCAAVLYLTPSVLHNPCRKWASPSGGDGTCRVSPGMVRQEVYGCLLTHHAIAALICRAATEADIGPGRVKFLRTVRIIRRRPQARPSP